MVDQLAPEDVVEDWSDLSTSDLGPGARLGRYELLLPIAYGGMARVWAARLQGQRGFQKIVAVKTILPHLAKDPEFERMFLDEARIAAGVHHPNVCEIYELGEEGHCLYLAMEWVNGDSLVHLLRAPPPGAPPQQPTRPGQPKPIPVARPIDPRVAAKICADACAGLHAAHNLTDDDGHPMNVVHRDVSPHNILVSLDGTVKVADFGVAKALGQMHNATVAGQIKGKVAYMAPEQITGSPVDRRSDVYAMGCVLYEATTGKPPFFGENDPQIMQAVLRGHYPRPTQLVRGYAPELEAIVARALAPDPRLRFADAEKMRVSLEEWLMRSGPLVTPAHLTAVVRDRIGPDLDRRRDMLKRASSTGDRDASWPGGRHQGGHTPSGRGGSQSRSGVMPAAGVPAQPRAPAPQGPPPMPPQHAMHAPPQGYGQPPPRAPYPSSPQHAYAPPAPPPASMHPQHAPAAPMPSVSLESTLQMDGPSPFGDAQPSSGRAMAGPMQPVPGVPAMQPLPPARARMASIPTSPRAIPPSRSAAGYWIAAAAGVVLAAVLAVVALVGWRYLGHRAPKAVPTASAAATTAPIAPATTTTTASTATTPTAPAASSAPAPASTTIEFQIVPDSAQIVLDGEAKPASVRELPRPETGKKVDVVVRAAGYQDETLTVDDATQSPVLIIMKERPQLPAMGGGMPTPPAQTGGGQALPPNPYRKP